MSETAAGASHALALELKSLFDAMPSASLAVAESLTCGRLQAAIGAVSGASTFFRGGVTAYSIEEKVRLLAVDRELASACDCVSAEVAAQMATGACRLFRATFAAATTGYAEPAPDRGVARPCAYWSVATRLPGAAGTIAQVKHGFIEREGFGRVAMQEAVVAAVLRALVDAVVADKR